MFIYPKFQSATNPIKLSRSAQPSATDFVDDTEPDRIWSARPWEAAHRRESPEAKWSKIPIKTLTEIRRKFELKLVEWPKLGYVYPDRTSFFIKMLMTLDPKSSSSSLEEDQERERDTYILLSQYYDVPFDKEFKSLYFFYSGTVQT